MQPSVIADIFFLHDRGKWNTLYWVVYMGSLMVGPIVSGPMADHVGWRSFWWLNVGLLGLASAMVAFMFPETRFHRLHPNEIIKQNSLTASEKDQNGHFEGSPVLSNEDPKITNATTPAETTDSPSMATPGLKTIDTADQDPHLGRGSPRKSQWLIFQPNAHPIKSILLDLWVPWKLFAFPIIEFASFVVSWSCSSFLTLNLTQSQAFAAPPYNLSSQTIGFFNFAILIGALIGLSTAGPLSDWVSMRATKRNNGIREPEMRLPAMIPYVIIMYLGNIVVSVGYEKHWPWQAIVVIGFACAGIQVAALPAIASTYAVDSYKPVAGSLFVSITVNKNVWGYGFSKFITPWAEEAG
jgi:MFS family permease